MLEGIDLLIILGYLLTTMFIGLGTRARAQKSTGHYLLGGKSISWVRLGLSNASGMFDISGTIWLVTLLFVYGIKSAWIPWLWPIFNQDVAAFLHVQVPGVKKAGVGLIVIIDQTGANLRRCAVSESSDSAPGPQP